MKRLMSCLVPGVLALLATACGTLNDGQDPALLATIQGQLTNTQSVDTPATIRVAVLWQSAQERGGYTVAQDVEVEPVFPSKFKLALTSAPPEAAMLTPGADYDENDGDPPVAIYPTPDDDGDQDTGSYDPAGPTGGASGPAPTDFDLGDGPTDMRLGFGFLLAYEDTNGNGRLDLIDEGAAAFVDRVLGANPELMLVYAEGNVNHPELVDPHGTPLRRGYNLFKFHACYETFEVRPDDDGNAIVPPVCTPEAAWLPINSLYDLPITSDPKFSSLMCRNSGGDDIDSEESSSEYPGQKPESTDPGPAGYPAPEDANCDEDRRAYRFSECVVTDHGPCRGTSTSCTTHYIGLPEGSVPPRWPCEL